MMNVKETLKKLHKRFPMMNLDELFDILDCYIEYDNYTIDWLNNKKSPNWEPNKVWYSDKITCQKDDLTTNGNPLKYYDGNTSSTCGYSSVQLATSH